MDAAGWFSATHSCHGRVDRKSTRLNSSHSQISYAVFCSKKKMTDMIDVITTERPRSGSSDQLPPTYTLMIPTQHVTTLCLFNGAHTKPIVEQYDLVPAGY